ncbi:MAG TPA: alcohol dehydrogenase catalytic domain-containing protein [Streptosporangiaceae bacterium]|jgi:2-desacetyl-2-hydroxyethyl bacteriochlorophyllide A dehydrogenase|nr:alcohol dehydrogenase catalytic domain-containing protein [Streptosporangiaceae bacterium]
MRAARWAAPGKLEITEAPDPAPAHGELVVAVGHCGVCGTDLHIADGEFPPTPYPIIPGHEFAGRVAAVGDGVPGDWRESDRVAVDPSLFCGHCPACRAGRGNLCANWNAIGDTVDGAFAEYVAVPAVNAYRIPDRVDDAQGALIEPLSCAVHGLRRIGPVLGEDVLLMGAGTMGLLLLQLLNRAGARSVTVVDRQPARLTAATAAGAGSVTTGADGLERRFGVAVDATGAPAAIETAFDSLERGGRLLIFGVTSGDATVTLSPFRIYNDEITIAGSMAVLNSFGAAADLMAAGAVDTAPLLGTPYPLDRFGDALAAVRAGDGIKVQVML